jgi:hypothetical protein
MALIEQERERVSQPDRLGRIDRVGVCSGHRHEM